LKRAEPGSGEIARSIRRAHQSLHAMSRAAKQIMTQLVGRNSPDRTRHQLAAEVACEPLERNPPDIRVRKHHMERWKRYENHRYHTAARLGRHPTERRLAA